MMKLRSLILAGFLALPFASSYGQVGISVNFAPPILPVVVQPPCPVAGYIWTPGYWGYGYDVGDYYWVPGAWVPPPSVGLLWTPSWWGWNNGVYVFNQGYWGPTVGFYGGINYGHGYWGDGYWGGRWSGNTFQYNTAVTRVNTKVVHNTFVDRTVVNRQVNRNRASFNGPNGVKAEPNAEQKAAAANAKKIPPTSKQLARQEAAAKDKNLQASVNKGKPKTDAIKSFNKREGVGQGKGDEQRLGAAAGAGAAKGENKIGDASDLKRQGAGAGQGQAGKRPGAAAGAGKAGKKPGDMAERHAQGAGGAGENANKIGAENRGNKQRNLQGNQAKARSGKMAGPGSGAAHGPRQMNQRSGQPKMGARSPQMGGKPPQMGGKRPRPADEQQRKKKPNKP
jgi:hypothetical protein